MIVRKGSRVHSTVGGNHETLVKRSSSTEIVYEGHFRDRRATCTVTVLPLKHSIQLKSSRSFKEDYRNCTYMYLQKCQSK